MIATEDNFAEMISQRPQILHISCHGHDYTRERKQYSQDEEEYKFLLLETELGQGKLVSEKTLNSLITKKLPDLNVVFVAACQSEFVGSIFHKCGASHVVCVQQDKEVLDEAAIHFTKSFYKNLFSG